MVGPSGMGGPMMPPNTAGPTGVGGPPPRQFSPSAPPQPSLPSLTARLPQGLSFPPGSLLRGQVMGQEKDNTFILRLNDQTVRAQSHVPLEVGQTFTAQVQGQKSGQLQLQLVHTPTTPLNHNDLQEALMHHDFPLSEENVELAKTMVEHGLPVNKESMSFVKGMLAQTEGTQLPTPARVGATFFLQSNNLPVTAQNVQVLANFIATNPQIGNQLMALQVEFRRLAESPSAQSSRCIELLTEVPGLLGELVLDPNQQQSLKKSSKRLKDLAKNMGIEARVGPGGGDDEEEWNLVQLMRQMRGQLEPDAQKNGLSRALTLMKGLEENLEAHQLINQAKTAELYGWFYLQVPLPLREGDTAEIWIRYEQDNEGQRSVDRENTVIEFLVCTEHLGELTFVLDMKGNVVDIEMGTPSEEVRDFAERYMPVLAERVAALGYQIGLVSTNFRPFTGRRQVVERQEFDSMERLNVQH